MITINEKIFYDNNSLINAFKYIDSGIDSICFFDIETTGLSPKVSSLYLIGASFIKDNEVNYIQWFANDYKSEKDILIAFSSFLKDFDFIVNYNGDHFDIPYLEKKYEKYNITSPFLGKSSIDIYKKVKHLKNILCTENMKLSTIEKKLLFNRNDSFTGKECIELYSEYMKNIYLDSEKSAKLLPVLLLHNHDDLVGTMLSSKLLAYVCEKIINPKLYVNESSITLTATAIHPFPQNINVKYNSTRIQLTDTTITVEITANKMNLKHFFDNYKDYYYLPEEDMAVHKSVGEFVDKEHREKAKKSNCYIKKEGLFLHIPTKEPLDNQTYFIENYKSKDYFILLNEKTSLTDNDIEKIIIYFFSPKIISFFR